MIKIIQNEKGFSLVELLVTIVLIGVISTSVLSLFSESAKRQFQHVKKTIALHFAQGEIEQILADKKNNGFNSIIETDYEDKTFEKVDNSVQITSVNDDLKKIVVHVNWINGSDSIVTYIGNY